MNENKNKGIQSNEINKKCDKQKCDKACYVCYLFVVDNIQVISKYKINKIPNRIFITDRLSLIRLVVIHADTFSSMLFDNHNFVVVNNQIQFHF